MNKRSAKSVIDVGVTECSAVSGKAEGNDHKRATPVPLLPKTGTFGHVVGKNAYILKPSIMGTSQ